MLKPLVQWCACPASSGCAAAMGQCARPPHCHAHAHLLPAGGIGLRAFY